MKGLPTWYKLLLPLTVWNPRRWLFSLIAEITRISLVRSGRKKKKEKKKVLLAAASSLKRLLQMPLSLPLFIFSPSQKSSLEGE